MSEDLKSMIAMYVLEFVFSVLGVVLTLVATKLQKKWASKQNGEIALETAKNVVLAVEQMYKDLGGPAKLEQALGLLTTSLAEKGIKLSATEMRTLIEGAVGSFNQVFKGEEKVEVEVETPTE